MLNTRTKIKKILITFHVMYKALNPSTHIICPTIISELSQRGVLFCKTLGSSAYGLNYSLHSLLVRRHAVGDGARGSLAVPDDSAGQTQIPSEGNMRNSWEARIWLLISRTVLTCSYLTASTPLKLLNFMKIFLSNLWNWVRTRVINSYFHCTVRTITDMLHFSFQCAAKLWYECT
jgi:hypothetical protein